MKFRIATLAAITCLTANVASAATFYTDQTSWESAMSSTSSIPLPVTASTTSFSAGGLTFTVDGSATNLIVGVADEWSTVIPGNDLAISNPEDFKIDFATTITGFSFLLHEPTTSDVKQDGCNAACVETTFSFKLFSGANQVGSFSLDPANDVANFVGFSSLSGFDKLVVDDVTNAIDNEFFGNFRTGVATIPLPAGLPLLLAGLGALGFVARRKSKAA